MIENSSSPCAKFQPQLWRNQICKECFYRKDQHTVSTDRDSMHSRTKPAAATVANTTTTCVPADTASVPSPHSKKRDSSIRKLIDRFTTTKGSSATSNKQPLSRSNTIHSIPTKAAPTLSTSKSMPTAKSVPPATQTAKMPTSSTSRTPTFQASTASSLAKATPRAPTTQRPLSEHAQTGKVLSASTQSSSSTFLARKKSFPSPPATTTASLAALTSTTTATPKTSASSAIHKLRSATTTTSQQIATAPTTTPSPTWLRHRTASTTKSASLPPSAMKRTLADVELPTSNPETLPIIRADAHVTREVKMMLKMALQWQLQRTGGGGSDVGYGEVFVHEIVLDE